MTNKELAELFKETFLQQLKVWNPTISEPEYLVDEPDLGVGFNCSIEGFGKKIETYFSITFEDGSLQAFIGDNADTMVVDKESLLEYFISSAFQHGIVAA